RRQLESNRSVLPPPRRRARPLLAGPRRQHRRRLLRHLLHAEDAAAEAARRSDRHVSTEAAAVELRPATPADKERILALLLRAFGSAHDPALWDWLFLHNTAGERLYAWVAESGGAIVAQEAMVPVRLSHGGE